ncbi:MAG: DNA polymerase III subunit delta [Firmicutes bacterium]|nr:DNA polymerase III subunit delta [Bacillota bacterium]
MAYTKNKTGGEHPSKTIVKMASYGEQSGIWPRIVLLSGKERFLIDWSRGFLKEKLIEPASEALDCVTFSPDSTDIYELMAACDTMPLLSKRKLIIVDWPELFGLQNPKGIDQEGYKALCEYIPEVPESTMLLFICDRPNKTRPLYKAVAASGIVYDFVPLDDATLSGWMAKRLRAAGRSAAPSDLIDFARICGYGDPDRSYTLLSLENDLKKALSGCDKPVLSLDDLLENAAPQGEQNAFRLLDSAFSGNKGLAFEILHSTIEVQAPSKEVGAVMSFLGLLCSQLEIMLEGREREEEGEDRGTMAVSMGVNEYRLKKAMSAAGRRSAAELKKSLDSAFQVEKDIKNGVMPPRMALELFIAGL